MAKLISGDVHAKIIGAARDVMIKHGLTDWTVELVAGNAQCAKGLVLYHFGTKNELLRAVATQVRLDRTETRVRALATGGTQALDRLWEALQADATGGVSSLWVALVAHEHSRPHASLTQDDRNRLARAAEAAMELVPDSAPMDDLIDRLNGFELSLVQDCRPDQVRESYDRYWLGVLG
jgi:AcrR family transcriptional regulator